MEAIARTEKRPLWSRILRRIVILVAMGIALTQVARLWNYFNTGADQSEILFRTIEQIKRSPSVVEWADTQPEGAFFDNYSRDLIGERYGEAWQAWNNSLDMHRTEFLRDYFVDSLVIRLSDIDRGLQVRRVVLRHHLVPVLFSVDKQVIVFRDEGLDIRREIWRDGILMAEDREQCDFLVVMALTEGRWLVQHMKKLDDTFVPSAKPDDWEGAVPVWSGSDDEQLEVVLDAFSIGVNYYPRYSPWTLFWDQYSADTTLRDMELVHNLGFRAVRFFIPYYDSRDPVLAEKMADKIFSFLSIGHDAGLYMMPTLFDFPASYEITDFPAFNHYLQSVMEIIEAFRHVVIVDLKNEPDLDVSVYGNEKVERWIDFIVEQARVQFPEVPLTIGWSDPSVAHHFAGRLDAVSFHFYGDADQFDAKLSDLRTKLDEDTRIVLSEYGRSTFDPLWFPIGHSAQDQLTYVASIFESSRAAGIGTFVWCLYDYAVMPDEVFGWKPWIRGPQSRFGLVDQYGIMKPAARLFVD